MKFIGKCLLIEEKEKVLVIGDLHLGWEESLNRTGVFVSRSLFAATLHYLDKVFQETGNVTTVVLLGDVKHEFGIIVGQEWQDVKKLFDYLLEKCKEIVIVKGNHDAILEPIVRKYEKVRLKDYFIAGETVFMHGDRDFVEIHSKSVRRWVLGHAHPAVKLAEKNGAKVEKFKCFLIGKFKDKEVVIVPSFFEGNMGSDARENDLGLAWNFDLRRFNIRVVSDEDLEVFDFGMLTNL